MPNGTWVRSSGYGTRIDPVYGGEAFHAGIDLSAPLGTPILAAADGLVTYAGGPRGGFGNLIVIEHTIDGQRVATYYAHMYLPGIHVTVGQSVTAGQHIGDVGSAGKSTGPHLHIEVHPGGEYQPTIDPAAWLDAHSAVGIDAGQTPPALCTPGGQ
jgi:murein DD-endopeptidase MepM/ murein hydrolase activator NlpD